LIKYFVPFVSLSVCQFVNFIACGLADASTFPTTFSLSKSVIVFLAFQHSLIRGIVMSSLKG